MDFADEELHLEHLAVRFKLEETRDEFKKIFEQCQEELRKKGTPVKSDTPATTDAEKVGFSMSIHSHIFGFQKARFFVFATVC